MTFYQTAGALFIGLLVATMLRVDLDERSRRASQPEHAFAKRIAVLVALVAVSMLVGELVSLLVLYTHEATGTEHAIVGITALIALAGTVIPGIVLELRRVLERDDIDRTVRATFIATAGAGAGFAVLAVAFSGSTASGPAAPGPPKVPRWFTVYGTCASGACGLNERAAAAVSAPKVGELDDGAQVGVICQTLGGVLHAGGHASRVWDQLSVGSYVGDLFVTTPGTGTFSADLPRCAAIPRTRVTQG